MLDYVGRTLAFPFESPTRLARDLARQIVDRFTPVTTSLS